MATALDANKSKKAKKSKPTTELEDPSPGLSQFLHFSQCLEKELGISVGFSPDAIEEDAEAQNSKKSPKSSKKRKSDADDDQPTKQRTALHTTPYVSNTQISKVSGDIQQNFVDQTSALSLRTLSLLKKCVALQHSLNFPSRPPPTSNISLKDIEVNSKLPLNEQYIQLTLWNQIVRLNLKSNKNLDTFLYKQKKDEKDEEEKKNASEEPSEKKSFRDYYMEKLTSLFGDEIDQLREEKSFDEKKLSSLIDCLETGVNLFQESDRVLHLTELQSQNAKKKKNASVHLSAQANASAVEAE